MGQNLLTRMNMNGKMLQGSVYISQFLQGVLMMVKDSWAKKLELPSYASSQTLLLSPLPTCLIPDVKWVLGLYRWLRLTEFAPFSYIPAVNSEDHLSWGMVKAQANPTFFFFWLTLVLTWNKFTVMWNAPPGLCSTLVPHRIFLGDL